MSAEFVNQLRARTDTIQLTPDGAPAITIRVEMPEVWDVVRIVTPPDEPALSIKERALAGLFPSAEYHADFVLKLRGWEVLDEATPLSELGVRNGTTLLLMHRRKRPVR